MLKKLMKEQTPEKSPQATNGQAKQSVKLNGASQEPTKAQYSRQNPFAAKLVQSVKLNREGSQKDTRHVVLDLSGSHLQYRVGDSLGVYPSNCCDLVEMLIAELGAHGGESVQVGGQMLELRKALEHRFNLQEITEEMWQLLADCANAADAEKLRALAEDDTAAADWDVLGVLMEFPSARPPVKNFVAVLSPLSARLYSISSSLAAHPNQVHLTIGKVIYNQRGRLRKGVASTMFAERLKPGDRVPVFVQPSHGFGLMIMVGPGTGVAPFRAFLQERQAKGAKGKNWLLFGDQRRDCDFLYETEWAQYLESGLLTRLDTAFSRDQASKSYVQHRMLENGAEMFRWLEDGASFFVCGDAKRMAADVNQALIDLVAKHGKKSAIEARDYVTELSKAKRYLRDVY